MELHHGTIQVTSRTSGENKGTEFIVRLPVGRTHLKDEEIVSMNAVQYLDMKSASMEVSSISESRPEGVAEVEGKSAQLPLVLIVDDNADVRWYVRDQLGSSYSVLEAENGKRGVDLALETIPDLIISDVMMPKKDGYELCRILKKDEKTSHIPIILLTAKAGRDDKLGGLEQGADDYLTKPFDAKELKTRVKNLIEVRRKLRERFSRGVVLKPGEIAVQSMEDAFLKKVLTVVELHIGDEGFSVESLANEVAMSRMQLYRKLTALTNLSTSDFIRYIRLQRGMELLKRKAGSISEIAYSVGFSSPSYFTKCFHEQFGVAPSGVGTREDK